MAVTYELAKHRPDEIYLSTVVQLELYYGAYKSSRKEQNLAKLERFFLRFYLLTKILQKLLE
ncbi:hypothetical protein BH695_2570 [Microcystis aeruginosa PCC 7806SL]|uniref:PIN domain-containing protein n=1 Tax=Microcystis aeruginosa PCC 7806SL TaxID=1903187 RepID=A0AB33BWW8_MICA7|nr:hypothetical protein BH695_2570 [Microcystis aeruginosa PCC 7806SL]